MFRSIWENGERGTPEQWKIKPKLFTQLILLNFFLIKLYNIFNILFLFAFYFKPIRAFPASSVPRNKKQGVQ